MRIGQLANALGCTVETIRFYEKQGLLPAPHRTNGNFRKYDEEHVQRLSFICNCRSLDLSLNEIKTLLSLENHNEQRTEVIVYLTVILKMLPNASMSLPICV